MKVDFTTEFPREGKGIIKWEASGDPEVLGMGTANLDFRCADHIVDALTKAAQEGMFGYHFKPRSYYSEVAAWYKRRCDVHVEPEWIRTTPGTWLAMSFCLEAFTNPGDNILVNAPYFFPIQTRIQNAKCNMIINNLVLKDGKYQFDLEDFEQKIIDTQAKVYIMINPQNPTGRVFTREELTAIGNICVKHNVLIISDEVHQCVLFDGNKHIPMFSVSEEIGRNTIVVTAPSKGYNLMDLTFALVVIPDEEKRERYKKVVEGFGLSFATNYFGITGTRAAFAEESDDWLDQMNAYVQNNLEILEEGLKDNPYIDVIRPEGGFLAWLDCRKLNMAAPEMKEYFLKKVKVAFSWGESFGPEGEGFERINLGCSEITLREALKRINEN